jgi:peptidase M1-like protein
LRILRPLAVLALSACLAVAAHAESVSDLVAAYETLHVGEAKTVSDFNVTVGHGVYKLPAGTVSPVLAGDRQVGLFLARAGTFTYETTNKDELSGLRYNAHNGGVKYDDGADKAVVSDAFGDVLLLGNGLPEAGGAAAPSQQAAFDAHQELFARNIFDSPASILFAYQATDNPQARLVRGEVSGKTSPFIHLFDDAHANDETLHVLLRQTWRMGRFKDSVYPLLLSRQAIGRGNRDTAPARVLLTDVDVDLTGTMDEKGTLTVVETIVPQKRAASAFRFKLMKLILMETRDRHYNLRAVTDEKGRKLSFAHDVDDLVVGLAEPAPAGKPVKLRFEVDGDFLYRPEKSNFWELGIFPWFPWVREHEQIYKFHSVVKVEKPFVAFASGKTVRREEEGNYNVIETRLDTPVPWVAILAGRYQFSEEVRKGVMIRVASFISKNEEAYKKLRNIAEAAIDYYPFFLGPFPFDEINVIEKTDGLGYGQAPAGIVFITSEAFMPLRRDVNEAVGGVNMRFAHEIAHMYFGASVRMPSSEEQWLDEAFAEYSAALFMKQSSRPGDYEKAFLHWKADAKESAKHASIPMANRIYRPADPLGSEITRAGLIYAKGAYLLAGLHRELGDTQFLTFMKSYQRSFHGKAGSTSDVIGLLQFVTKKDYAPYFEQYYYGTDMPDVKIK